VKHRLIPYFIATFLAVTLLPPVAVQAAPYAAVVMDARNGKIYHSRNADTRLHPASLTKMMTLYVAFQNAARKSNCAISFALRPSNRPMTRPPQLVRPFQAQRPHLPNA